MEQNQKNTLDEQLIDAAGQHNLQKVMELIEKGANPNYVRYTDSNCWYSGNTHTALYTAVHTTFKNQSDFVNVIQYLLKKGANPNFKAVRGGWNHCTEYPLFSGVSYTINKFTETKQKIRFLQIFVKNGGNINQGEHHSRSKNWRGYSTSKNFLFEMLDGCGINSKMRQLVKLSQTFNFQEAKNSHYNSLKEQYQKYKAKNEQKEKEKEKENENKKEQVAKVEQQQQSHKEEKKKQPDIQLIKAIINLGGSVNSARNQHFWQNYQNDHYEDQEDYSLSKYDTKQTTQRETILHRCIMNNITELVQLLIEKGAKVDAKCVFTVGKPAYPHQWPEKLKQRKMKQKLNDLKQNEVYKNESVQQLQKATTEQEKKRITQRIESYDFEIYKCQRYQIQNQCPIRICQKQQVSCQQLAQIFNVSAEIKQLLKNAPK